MTFEYEDANVAITVHLLNVKHSRQLHIHVSLGTVHSGGHVCWDLTNVR